MKQKTKLHIIIFYFGLACTYLIYIQIYMYTCTFYNNTVISTSIYTFNKILCKCGKNMNIPFFLLLLVYCKNVFSFQIFWHQNCVKSFVLHQYSLAYISFLHMYSIYNICMYNCKNKNKKKQI